MYIFSFTSNGDASDPSRPTPRKLPDGIHNGKVTVGREGREREDRDPNRDVFDKLGEFTDEEAVGP